jgi:SAM-dependent methyltransferase
VAGNPRSAATLAAKVIRRLRPAPKRHNKGNEELWRHMGKHQFDFIVSEGLRPDHNFLDVGCGALRGGLNYIRYLEPGRYVGFDIEQVRLDTGLEDLQAMGLADKNVTLVRTGDFDVSHLGRKFDFAIAQSVFSHLPLNPIIRCLVQMRRVLAPDGRFYATFFEAPAGEPHIDDITHPDRPPSPRKIVTHFDRDPFHYDLDTFQWAARKAGMRLDYIGDWNHPRGQRMLRFMRDEGAQA